MKKIISEVDSYQAHMPGQEMVNRKAISSSKPTLNDLLKLVTGMDQGNSIAHKVLAFPMETIMDDFAETFLKINEIKNKLAQAQDNPVFQNNEKAQKDFEVFQKHLQKMLVVLQKLTNNLQRFALTQD